MKTLLWIVAIAFGLMLLAQACASSGGVPVVPEKYRDTVPSTTLPQQQEPARPQPGESPLPHIGSSGGGILGELVPGGAKALMP